MPVRPAGAATGAGLLLVGLSFLAIRAGRRCPYLPVGWLWFVGTLVPVIGLVQVGEQAMADRYTYVPLIGLFIVLAWGTAELATRWRGQQRRRIRSAKIGGSHKVNKDDAIAFMKERFKIKTEEEDEL